jgi:hypothetical protein
MKKPKDTAPTMPEWKRKALAMFPDLRDELDEEDASIYTLFFELLPRCHEAHKNGDIRFELPRIYAYAEWCFHQTENDLWNAAGVAFYEHLIDEPETQEAIPEWIKPDIFEGISGLFEWRLGSVAYQELQDRYRRLHPSGGAQ